MKKFQVLSQMAELKDYLLPTITADLKNFFFFFNLKLFLILRILK